MTPDQRLLAIGCYINSALYLTGVFVVSLFVHQGFAWKAALMCAGVTFLAYAVQISAPASIRISSYFVGCSIALGFAAGCLAVGGY